MKRMSRPKVPPGSGRPYCNCIYHFIKRHSSTSMMSFGGKGNFGVKGALHSRVSTQLLCHHLKVLRPRKGAAALLVQIYKMINATKMENLCNCSFIGVSNFESRFSR